MKSKAPLSLMEQLIMVLVFALAAAVCVQAFVLADRLSVKNERRDQAVLRAETVAEVYKNCRGDSGAAAGKMGGSVEKNVWTTWWNANGGRAERKDAVYRVTVTPEAAEKPQGRAAVTVTGADGSNLFTLKIAWQEAAESAR